MNKHNTLRINSLKFSHNRDSKVLFSASLKASVRFSPETIGPIEARAVTRILLAIKAKETETRIKDRIIKFLMCSFFIFQ